MSPAELSIHALAQSICLPRDLRTLTQEPCGWCGGTGRVVLAHRLEMCAVCAGNGYIVKEATP